MIITKKSFLYTLLLLAITLTNYNMKREHKTEQTTGKQIIGQAQLPSGQWVDIVGLILSQDAPIQLLYTNFPFNQLIPELKAYIVELLVSNSNAATLNEAAKTINALAQTDKELNNLINNPQFCLKLIKRLSQRFNCSDQEAAEALQTKEAKQCLDIQKQFLTLCQQEDFNEEEFNALYEKYKQYVDLDFTFYVFNPNQEKIEVTLLIQATVENNCLAIQTILKHGANINKATTSKGATALIFAATNGNTDPFQCLLTNPNIAIDQQDNTGRTALMQAAMRNNCPFIQTLLKREANINKATHAGLTALMFAVGSHQLDAVQCLLDDPNIVIDQQNDKEETALLIAIEINNCPIIKTLLKHRANVNKANLRGLTPLMFAIMRKNKDTIQCLLDDPNILVDKQDIEGTTALLGAILFLKNGLLIIKQLLDAGANPEIADNYGVTPLQAAQETGDQEIIKLVQNAIDERHRRIKK